MYVNSFMNVNNKLIIDYVDHRFVASVQIRGSKRVLIKTPDIEDIYLDDRFSDYETSGFTVEITPAATRVIDPWHNCLAGVAL